MPFTSGPEHRSRYVPPSDLQQRLTDIHVVIDAIRVLPINKALKHDMLDEAIWQVTYATGNTQSTFMGRYRSERVITEVGLKIERDHVYRRKTLLQMLLNPSADLEQILDFAQCCVVITAEEHRSVDAIDGWQKYEAAHITVYDMLTGFKITHA